MLTLNFVAPGQCSSLGRGLGGGGGGGSEAMPDREAVLHLSGSTSSSAVPAASRPTNSASMLPAAGETLSVADKSECGRS